MISVEIIDGKECVTVAEYAAKMGISLSTAYRRLRDSQMTKYIVTRENGDNRKFVDVSVFSGDLPLSRDNHILKNENHIVTDENHIVTDDNGHNAATKVTIDLLRDQLSTKDAEISRLHDELDRLHRDVEELHKLLDQAHQLAAMSQTKELEEPKGRRWRHGK